MSGYRPDHRSPAQDAVLDRMMSLARSSEPGAVALLDVDGCLFDTRWRQVHILRAYGAIHGLDALTTAEPHHFRGRDMAATLAATGLPVAQARGLEREVRAFWSERFFDEEHCALDCPMPGAVRFVRGLHEAGLHVVYLTGRDARMRPASARAFHRHHLPLDVPGARLLTKDDASLSDRAWKAKAVEEVRGIGPVALALDNEPENLELFEEAFPDALRVWVETDCSSAWRGDAVEAVIRGFLRT